MHSLHCWVSFSGFSEAYFEYCHYNRHSKWKEGMFHYQSSFNDQQVDLTGEMLPELTRKHVADMYYAGELEKEVRAFPHRLKWSFKMIGDRDEHIKAILNEIRDKCYEHMPAKKCSERGLYLYTIYTNDSELPVFCFRLRVLLFHRWELEANLPSLHVSC